jgi:hypothetical protein
MAVPLRRRVGGGAAQTRATAANEMIRSPIARIHERRLAWRDPEQLGVQLVDPLEEPAAAHPRIGQREPRIVRGAVARQLAHGVAARAQQGPERGQIGGGRQPARDPHDRDGDTPRSAGAASNAAAPPRTDSMIHGAHTSDLLYRRQINPNMNIAMS